jgi:hypothetical protein
MFCYIIFMSKKKYLDQMKDLNSVVLGGALVGQNAQLLQPGAGFGTGALVNAGVGTLGITGSALMSGVAFNIIDGIYKSGSKKKRK